MLADCPRGWKRSGVIRIPLRSDFVLQRKGGHWRRAEYTDASGKQPTPSPSDDGVIVSPMVSEFQIGTTVSYF